MEPKASRSVLGRCRGASAEEALRGTRSACCPARRVAQARHTSASGREVQRGGPTAVRLVDIFISWNESEVLWQYVDWHLEQIGGFRERDDIATRCEEVRDLALRTVGDRSRSGNIHVHHESVRVL